jgi:chlorobactene glucosyltransferase
MLIAPDSRPLVSVIIPARNEEENISGCIHSVMSQDYEHYEVIVVDDQSTDSTAQVVEDIQKGFGRIRLIRNTSLKHGWTGKNHALHLGVKEAKGDWLLFLDADTELYLRALSRALDLSISKNIDMLSLSPEQVLLGFWEMTIQPAIFEFLESIYDYGKVNAPDINDAAANGQFILIKRNAYTVVGGHSMVRDKVLEDVELAKRVKRNGFRLHFAYGRGIVRCRMYKSLKEIIDGWSKNLYLLIDYDRATLLKTVSSLGFFHVLPFIILFYSLVLLFAKVGFLHASLFTSTLCLTVLLLHSKCSKFKTLNYPRQAVFLYPLGVLFSMLLLFLSAYRTGRSEVEWKGRRYRLLPDESPDSVSSTDRVVSR